MCHPWFLLQFVGFTIYGRDMTSTSGASAANSLQRRGAANKPCLELLSRICNDRREQWGVCVRVCEACLVEVIFLYRQSDQTLEFEGSVISESMLNMSRQCRGPMMHRTVTNKGRCKSWVLHFYTLLNHIKSSKLCARAVYRTNMSLNRLYNQNGANHDVSPAKDLDHWPSSYNPCSLFSLGVQW